MWMAIGNWDSLSFLSLGSPLDWSDRIYLPENEDTAYAIKSVAISVIGYCKQISNLS
jgi:hypothetical protein